MSAQARRAQLAPGYILHHHPYRDTSRILEVFTRDAGRISIFARGVRGPKAKLASELQPFRLLLLSWSGKGEAPMLVGAESAPDQGTMPPACLMSGFYLNELLLKLTHRHDPVSGVFLCAETNELTQAFTGAPAASIYCYCRHVLCPLNFVPAKAVTASSLYCLPVTLTGLSLRLL